MVWIAEAVNALFPVARVGGEIVAYACCGGSRRSLTRHRGRDGRNGAFDLTH